MKRVKLLVLLLLLVCATIFVGYKSHRLSGMELILANIEAVANVESGGIELKFCFQSGTSGNLITRPACEAGTIMSMGTPDRPGGTIYPCKNEISGGLISKSGYCYVKAK